MTTLFDTSAPGVDVQPPPLAGRYAVLYVDDPWPERGGGQIKRGADKHYDLLSVDDIARLPIGLWAAPNAHIYMWATNNYLEDAFRVMRARGFRYVTTVTWVKDRIGLGQYYRGKTEHCLFGVRGRLPYLVAPSGKRAQGTTVLYAPDPDAETIEPPADLPTAFEAKVPTSTKKFKRRIHSRKPEKMREYVELVSGAHGPKLECFARVAAPGWDAWGNEAPAYA